MKRICIILICLVCALTLLVACDGGGKDKETEHTHTFDPNWASDESDHWHPSTCDHVDEVSEKASHVDEDGNDVCDVCGYRQKHTHTYETKWTQGESTHYYKNTCGHDDLEKYRKDEAPHADESNDGVCDVCAYDYGHTHTYAEVLTKTEGGHWHAPTCGHDVPGTELADHADADNNGVCDACAYDYDHAHTYDEAWDSDEDAHWHKVTCGHNVPVLEKNAHADADKDGYCDVCARQVAHFHSFEEDWTGDADGHFHKAACGHDVKSDEQPHNGYETDGVCDTCGYTVFRFYTVTVTLPDNAMSVTAPDGTASTAFKVKEGTNATFTVTMPNHILITDAAGAAIDGKPVKDGMYHTYTLKASAVTADTAVTLTIQKTSNVQIIVSDGELEMTIEKAWKEVTGTLTLDIPSAGHYIIYSTSHAGLSGVTFRVEGNTAEQNDTAISYAFDVAEAGKLTVSYTYFPMSKPESGKEICHYVISKIDPEKVLDTLTGENYSMPTNADVTVTFTVPTAGLYMITSTYPVSWDGDVTTPHVFMVEEGNLTHSVKIHYQSESDLTFPFDWDIQPIGDPIAVSIGDNAVTAPVDSYYAITYTAEKDGAYCFSVASEDVVFYRWYVSEWATGLNSLGSEWISDALSAGDTITLYLRVNPYGQEEVMTPIDTTLNVIFSPVKGEAGYTVTPDTHNIFSPEDWEDGEYEITLPAGAEISIDGGTTWHTELTTVIPAYESLIYIIRSESASVTFSIEKLTYEYELIIGDNTVNLVPDKEYTFILTGTVSSDYYVDYYLAWTDDHVTVSYMDTPLTSGDLIEQYDSDYSMLTVVYTGSKPADLTFTLTDGYSDAEEE